MEYLLGAIPVVEKIGKPVITLEDLNYSDSLIAIYQYQNYNAAKINRSIRSGLKTSRVEIQIDNINSFADQNRTISELVLYRGCGIESFTKQNGELYKVDAVFQVSAFLSTSIDIDIARDFANGSGKHLNKPKKYDTERFVYEIRVPKNYPIVDINKSSEILKGFEWYFYQREILLKSDTRVKVIDIKRYSDGEIELIILEALS
jgi:ADP-ribosyltransferase exoenzyme